MRAGASLARGIGRKIDNRCLDNVAVNQNVVGSSPTRGASIQESADSTGIGAFVLAGRVPRTVEPPSH